jgi:site-specific DNA-methyltransferase (adenine-specific)
MVIHLSPWQSAPWPEQVDCIITDPPYSERTHSGNNGGRREKRDPSYATGNAPIRQIDYSSLSPADVHEWAAAWAPRVRYWMAVMCDHTLIPHWSAAMTKAGLYSFPPVACVISGMTCRLTGDGPSSWAVYLMVGRTPAALLEDFGRFNDKGKPVRGWGTLPGGYWVGQERPDELGDRRIGGKPLPLMQQIIRDYSRPGMLVADPCAGHGTTLVAAKGAGRLVWGAERDPAAHRAACDRLDAVQVPTLIPPDRSLQSNLL